MFPTNTRKNKSRNFTLTVSFFLKALFLAYPLPVESLPMIPGHLHDKVEYFKYIN